MVATVNVVEPDVVLDAGLKLAVAPVGRPVTLKLTVPEKPDFVVRLAENVVLFPWAIVREAGVSVSEKVEAGEFTTSVEVAVCVSVPLAPVTVSVYAPAGVVPAVVTLSVEVPEPVTVVGLNVPVAPEGNPVTLRETAPLKPFTAVTVCV